MSRDEGKLLIVYRLVSATQHLVVSRVEGGHMASNRTVTDTEGRIWTCIPGVNGGRQGQDIVLTCTTPSIATPVTITVSWQWEKMAAKGLARLISAAAA